MLSNAIIKLGYSHLTLAALRGLQSPSASREIQWISMISTICNFYFTFLPSFLHSFIYCSILKFDFAIRGSLFSYSSSVPKHGSGSICLRIMQSHRTQLVPHQSHSTTQQRVPNGNQNECTLIFLQSEQIVLQEPGSHSSDEDCSSYLQTSQNLANNPIEYLTRQMDHLCGLYPIPL